MRRRRPRPSRAQRIGSRGGYPPHTAYHRAGGRIASGTTVAGTLGVAVLTALALPTLVGVATAALAAARPAPTKTTRCFTTSAGDQICLKYDCRGERCVKTHTCIRSKGSAATVCTPVTGRTSSNGLGCSAGIPPYYYEFYVGQPLYGGPPNDPHHIGVTVDKHLPVPDGFDARVRITWQGKHGGAICLAKLKITGPGWHIRCSAGPCDPNLPSIKGNGSFDVLFANREGEGSQRAEIIIRGA